MPFPWGDFFGGVGTDAMESGGGDGNDGENMSGEEKIGAVHAVGRGGARLRADGRLFPFFPFFPSPLSVALPVGG